MIRFACPKCGKEFSGADELAGQKARCKKCNTLFTIGAAPPAANLSPAKRQAQPARVAPRQAPAHAGQRPRTAPQAAPLAQPDFNLDLSALGSFDAPAMPAALGSPLGTGVLGGSNFRRKKKTNLLPWLIFSGTGVAAVGIIAILVTTLLSFASSSMPNNPAAYFPPNPVMAASVRLRNLLDRAATIPQLKPQIDQALATAVAEGLDPRDIDEVFVVFDGATTYIAARMSRPVDLSKLAGVKTSGESHQGLPIYSMQQSQAALRPTQMAGAAVPRVETVYCIMPTTQLVVGSGDPQRLKAMIDQAKEGRGAALDLPTGHDLAIRVKDVKQLAGNPLLSANAASNELVGITGTLSWNDKLAINLQLDMKDPQTATDTEQKIKTSLQVLSQLAKKGQPNSATAVDLSSVISVLASGAQLRISGSLPTNQLSSLAPPAAGASPHVPGAAPMPSGNMQPMGAPSGFPGR